MGTKLGLPYSACMRPPVVELAIGSNSNYYSLQLHDFRKRDNWKKKMIMMKNWGGNHFSRNLNTLKF